MIDASSVRSALLTLWDDGGSFEDPSILVSNCGLRFTLRRGRKKKGEFVCHEKPQYYRLLIERRGGTMTESDLEAFLRVAMACLQVPAPTVSRAMMGGGYFLEWDVRGPPKGQKSNSPGRRVTGKLGPMQQGRAEMVVPSSLEPMVEQGRLF